MCRRNSVMREGQKGRNLITENRTQEQPYEKFMRFGAEALTETELLAIILRTGTRNCSALALAEKVFSLARGRERGLNALHHISLKELMQIPGIGEVKAVKLKSLAELSKRMAKERAVETLSFDTPETVADYFMEELRHEEKEKVLLLSLDTRLHLIEKSVLSIGTVNYSLLSAREVFVQAFRNQASSIMLLHNHPSGDVTPSRQDVSITEKIKEAGELLGIPLTDHIVIGNNTYTSFRQCGLL